MSGIDLVDLRMSSRQWELQGLVPAGKALDHVSVYGTDLSGEKKYREYVSDVCEPSGESHYQRNVYDTWIVFQILSRRILQWRIESNDWTFGYIARDTTMFYRDSKSLCSGH